MTRRTDFSSLDLNIGRARIGLSVVTLLSIYIDPTIGGAFEISPTLLAVLLLHLAYSIAFYTASESDIAPGLLPSIWTVLDIVFATLLAFLSEGPTSPSYAFFAFAIIAAGCRFGFRVTIVVTLCSVAVYLMTIVFGHQVQRRLYLMRPAYLAIAGYLIAFLGQRRVNFEARVRELELTSERERIARSLHDGYVQALASMNLKLAACRELLLKDRSNEALERVTELRQGVAREYDEVRSYLRTLVNLDQHSGLDSSFGEFDTRFKVDISFDAQGLLVEQIFQLVLEGIRNIWRHGRAASAAVKVGQTASLVKIIIEDDGKGFNEGQPVPWAIASRVAEFGGHLTMANADPGGARLEIEMPAER
jgi:signal transduction histidine kinase